MEKHIEKGIAYTSLDALVRLRYKVRGAWFRPFQSVDTLLLGSHGSRLRGRGLNFEELRAYQLGDDIRTMDWKVTNRMKKPHVRVYTEERERYVWLLVDQRLDMFFGSKVRMKSVAAAETAALAAWRTLADKDKVGGIVFNDHHQVPFKPQRQPHAVTRLLGAVAGMNQELRSGQGAQSSPEMLGRVLDKTLKLCSHDNLILIISDMGGWNSSVLGQIKELTRHNDVVVCLIFDPLEIKLPHMGRTVISNGWQQIEFDTHKKHIREAFEREFTTRFQDLQNRLKIYQVPVIPVDTTLPVQDQLYRTLNPNIS